VAVQVRVTTLFCGQLPGVVTSAKVSVGLGSQASVAGGAASEAVLCLVDATQDALPLLAARTAAGLASFSSTTQLVEPLAHWRQIRLSGMAGESPSTGA